MNDDATSLNNPLERSLAGPPGVAAFDADGTLWFGDIAMDFAEWMIARGDFDGSTWETFLALDARDPEASAVAMSQFYGGLPTSFVVDAVRTFWHEGPARQWIPETRDAVRRLHHAGWRVLIVSASPRPLVEPITDHLPVDVVAFELEEHGDVYTGRPRGIPCVGVGKVTALEAHEVPAPGLAAGNSAPDLPMLRAARIPWAIHPDDVLRQEAELAGWSILSTR